MEFTEKEMKIVYKISWSFHRTTGIDIDEIIGEAFLAACESKTFMPDYYDNCKSKYTTYMMSSVRNHLINWMRKHDTVVPMPEEDSFTNHEQSPEDIVIFKQELESLSDSAKGIAKMIFESPGEFLDHRPKIARGQVSKFLRETCGWKYTKIWDGMRELQTFVRERQ